MTDAAARLAAIKERMDAAATRAGRSPDAITLVAVTKNRTVEEIEPLIAAGHRTFGESRVQEAQLKWPALLARHKDIELHCIGRLQSNKSTDAVRLFDVIHAIDRRSLLDALATAAAKEGKAPDGFVQVNIGDELQKGGCTIPDTGALVEAVRASPISLAGLMCIPPAELQPGPYFALLAELARRHDVTGLSMGMSADFEAAILLGATVVRVGSALFEDV